MTVYITDWSNHNSGALTQSQADGLVSFWHKCTDGDHWYADPYFKSHVDMARALGVDSEGSYHVLWGNRDLISQARWYVDRVRAQAPDAKIFMSDNEPFGYNVAPTIAQVNAFNDEVARYAGVPAHSVLAYCPQWHYGSTISGLRYPWVQSNYGSNPTGAYRTVYEQTVGDGSSRWNGPTAMPFLQYGSRTDVGDANAFRGTVADFFAFIGQELSSLSDAYALLDEGTRTQTGSAVIPTQPDPDHPGKSMPQSQVYRQLYYLGLKLDDIAAACARIEALLVAGGGGGDVGPIAVTGSLSGTLTGSVSGSVSGTVSGSISSVP